MVKTGASSLLVAVIPRGERSDLVFGVKHSLPVVVSAKLLPHWASGHMVNGEELGCCAHSSLSWSQTESASPAESCFQSSSLDQSPSFTAPSSSPKCHIPHGASLLFSVLYLNDLRAVLVKLISWGALNKGHTVALWAGGSARIYNKLPDNAMLLVSVPHWVTRT